MKIESKHKEKDSRRISKYANNGMLNKPGFHSMAAFDYKIKAVRSYFSEYNAQIDAHINLSDCNKKITIDFSSSNEDEYENSIIKAKKLKEVFETIEKELTLAKEDIEKDKKRQAKIEAEKLKTETKEEKQMKGAIKELKAHFNSPAA